MLTLMIRSLNSSLSLASFDTLRTLIVLRPDTMISKFCHSNRLKSINCKSAGTNNNKQHRHAFLYSLINNIQTCQYPKVIWRDTFKVYNAKYSKFSILFFYFEERGSRSIVIICYTFTTL